MRKHQKVNQQVTSMSARENILKSIAANQPRFVSLPKIARNTVIDYQDCYAQFKIVLESIGGKVELIPNLAAVKEKIRLDNPIEDFIINAIFEMDDEEEISSLSAFELEKLEKVYIKGSVGVAENGAVWVYESQMQNRLLPFICQKLVLIIDKKDIVATMHEAYDKIDTAREGFGVFIAGPSKTADIEQSLVIGAHGARSTTVFVVG